MTMREKKWLEQVQPGRMKEWKSLKRPRTELATKSEEQGGKSGVRRKARSKNDLLTVGRP